VAYNTDRAIQIQNETAVWSQVEDEDDKRAERRLLSKVKEDPDGGQNWIKEEVDMKPFATKSTRRGGKNLADNSPDSKPSAKRAKVKKIPGTSKGIVFQPL
jgi:hypothetical protein